MKVNIKFEQKIEKIFFDTEFLITSDIKLKTEMRNILLLLIVIISQIGCSPVEPVMSKAGVMTHPNCAKYSTEEAVATCESGMRQRGGNPRFSFGVGFTRLIN